MAAVVTACSTKLAAAASGGRGGGVHQPTEELPGFRFHPTDEELVGFYLRRKVDNVPITRDIIKQVDVYKYDPWDLPMLYEGGGGGGGAVNGGGSGEKEWYFFCLRGRKYKNSVRPNRVITGSGFWKATGIDKLVYAAGGVGGGSPCIGLKKSLVYYRGVAGKGTKTDWMMHEFRLPPPSSNNNPKNNYNRTQYHHQEAEIWTICRIFKRSVNNYKKHPAQYWKQQQQSVLLSSSSPSSSSSSASTVTTARPGFNNSAIVGGAGFQQQQDYGGGEDEMDYNYMMSQYMIFGGAQQYYWNYNYGQAAAAAANLVGGEKATEADDGRGANAVVVAAANDGSGGVHDDMVSNFMLNY